ncbi:MAG: TolB family protein, partial [Candidatus Cryptobacteroides sp.]
MKEKKPADGYVGKSEIKVEDGRMTPETLLSFGRLSDPQMSPDGGYILYGVSYTSIEGNRSCRNLHICSADGKQEQEITSFGESVSNARWIDGGKRIAYIHSGQICTMKIRRNSSGEWETGREKVISDIPSGVYGFEVSPDGSSLMYSTGIKSRVQAPSDIYGDLPKADAICTDDLMYRHWDHWVKEIPHTFTAKFPKNGKITPETSRDILGAGEEAFELPIEPFGGLEQLSWSPDGKF